MILDLNEVRSGKTDFKSTEEAPEYQLADADGRFGAPLEVRLTVARSDTTLTIKGTVSTRAEYACSRCLEEFSQPLNAEFLVVCLPDGAETGDEEEFINYNPQAAEIDLTPFLREQVILALPVKPLCRQDCAGLCAGCGVNLNTGKCTCKGSGGDPRWDKLKNVTPSS